MAETDAEATPDPMERVVERLLQFPLFEGFTSHGLGRLVQAGEVREEGSGDVLCREGDPAGDVVLLLRGVVEVFVERDGESIAIAEIPAGRVLGEIALLSELPRSASLRAQGDIELLVWQGKVFRRLLYSDAGFARRIFRDSLRTVIEGEQRMIRERLESERQAGS